jgi:hypothetical protein
MVVAAAATITGSTISSQASSVGGSRHSSIGRAMSGCLILALTEQMQMLV